MRQKPKQSGRAANLRRVYFTANTLVAAIRWDHAYYKICSAFDNASNEIRSAAARARVWVYPRAASPRFVGAPVIYETTRSYERLDIFSLPEGSDVTVELYGAAVSLRLEGEIRRVHVRRFDHVTFTSEEEARHAFMRLWREVEMLESPAAIEFAAERWLKAGR